MGDNLGKGWKKSLENTNMAGELEQTKTSVDLSPGKILNDINLPSSAQKRQAEKRDKQLKAFGSLALTIFAAGMIIFCLDINSVTASEARSVLDTKVSTSLSAGTTLLVKDENIGKQDYTIAHSYSEEETKIWVWDYAAEDGDYVQIFVNGTPVTEPFMIKNKPREFVVPAVGEVQVKGIRDGGGGITYAVNYQLNDTSYFNSAPEGEFNTYTLVKE